jgi:hypothetical protein
MGFEQIAGMVVGIGCGGALLVLFVLGLFARADKAGRKRRWRTERPEQARALPALAERLGWAYTPRDDRSLEIIDVLHRGKAERPFTPTDRSKGLKGLGSSGRAVFGFRFVMNKTTAAEHVMSFEESGRQYVLFQQRWNEHRVVHHGESEDWVWEEDPDTADYASTVAVRLPGPTPFVCVTKRWRGAVAGLVGADTTPESQRFNREYLAFAEHQRFGHDILHRQLTDWIMRRTPAEGTFLVIADGWCHITVEDILKADQIQERLTVLREFAGLIPAHVWNTDYGLDRLRR